MKENLKKISLLAIVLVCSLSLTTFVKAEEVCKTYKNYYFFNAINRSSDISNGLTDGSLEIGAATYFPQIHSNAEAAKGDNKIKKYEICLRRNNVVNKENENYCDEIWDIDDFYTEEKKLLNNPQISSFSIGNKESNYSYKSEQSTDSDGDEVITTYYKHGIWFEIDGNDEVTNQGGAGVSYKDETNETLSNGSIIATTEVNMSQQNNMMRAVVRRTITEARYNMTTPFALRWENGGNEIQSVLMPALYYIEYQVCTDEEPGTNPTPTPTEETKYTATFNYYKYKDNKTTTEKVDFDDSSVENPKIISDLTNGTYTHTLPKQKGCKIVDKNGKNNDSYNFEYTINDKNEIFNIYYHCPVEDTGSELPTGDALIYIAWVVGFGALGYAVYYLIKYNKARKEEI